MRSRSWKRVERPKKVVSFSAPGLSSVRFSVPGMTP
jgi:hypothetical protein